jgi:hypothetical protein
MSSIVRCVVFCTSREAGQFSRLLSFARRTYASRHMTNSYARDLVDRAALLAAIAVLVLCGWKGFTLPRLAVVAGALVTGLVLSPIEYWRIQREEKERKRKLLINFREQLKSQTAGRGPF